MFNEEEDWSDEQDAQALCKSVFNTAQKGNNDSKSKTKVVGKKSLLRTLQTLGSIPEWKSDNHQQDSDSETGAAPSRPKRKKKRSKKRRHAKTSEEQSENGDIDQSVKEVKLVAKKTKKDTKTGGQNVKTTSAVKTKDEETIQSAKANIDKPENQDKRSRQQWKNKMKSKRKCKNKYREKKEEIKAESLDTPKEKEEVKQVLSLNNNSRKTTTCTAAPKKKNELERKAQKRKKTEQDTETSRASKTLREEKQLTEKGNTKGGREHTVITDDHQQLPMKSLKPELSREEILKRERLRKMLSSKPTEQKQSPVEQTDVPVVPEAGLQPDRSASLRSRMEQRLESARFRYINEVLYSTSSGEAKRMFKQDPQAFWIYHKGYTAQVQKWPANPVDSIISYIQQKPFSLVVADFGCGDCKIAHSVKNKVHSFDLAATCELVTVCDMANVPLRDRSVDIAVFCLSLMGTNMADFLAEANRVLKISGVLKVAEVASRFDNVRSFVTGLANLGFKMVSKETENTHFYSFEFVKTGDAPENVKKFGLELKPCVYKKR